MSSKRLKDIDDESVLQPFLDAVYRELGFDFRRETKRDKQLAGIDLVLSHRGHEYYIDEKAATHYVNRPLKTFAFELNFQSYGQLRPGWLFDEHKDTTHYFLVSEIHARTKEVADVTHFRLVSVHRQKLLAYLNSKHWGRQFFETELPVLDEACPKYELSSAAPKARVVKTTHLVEEPLNLVIVLDDLIDAGVAKELVPGPNCLDKNKLKTLFSANGLLD
jgi:hypothetical protein